MHNFASYGNKKNSIDQFLNTNSSLDCRGNLYFQLNNHITLHECSLQFAMLFYEPYSLSLNQIAHNIYGSLSINVFFIANSIYMKYKIWWKSHLFMFFVILLYGKTRLFQFNGNLMEKKVGQLKTCPCKLQTPAKTQFTLNPNTSNFALYSSNSQIANLVQNAIYFLDLYSIFSEQIFQIWSIKYASDCNFGFIR